MNFKIANSIIIEKFGIWYSPCQLVKFMEEKNLDNETREALKIMYNRLCGKF
jgi:hypothetical protein